MFDNIRGIITFEAIVSEPEAFLNMLKSSSVTAVNLNYKSGKIQGDIYKSDFKELINISEKCSAQVSISDKKGSIFTVNKYRKRVGILLGIILAFAMAVYLSNIVMSIEIYGNETIPDKQIKSILEDNGICTGAFIPGINFRETERRIVSSVDDIAWIGIRSSGCKIQAEIREMDAPPEMVPTSVPCNIISSKDAQIVEIKNVHMGMLIPMLYDGVKKGDLLISGTVDDGQGGVYYAHSMGEIIGRYTEEVIFQQPYIDEQFDFGDTVTRKSLYFWGLKMPLYVGKKDFGQYEYDENMEYVRLFNLQFPVGILHSEYKPYTVNSVEYTSEQAKILLEDKIKLYEYNFFNGEDIKIVDKKLDFSSSNDKITVTVSYTLESNIGIIQEIMAK